MRILHTTVPAASALKGNLVGGTHDTKNEPIVERVIQNHAPALSSGTSVAAPTASAPAVSGASTTQNKDAPASHGVADAGVAAAAAKAASAAGLGHDEHESRSADLAGPGASGSGLTHVPTGGAAAESGVAAAAAKAANKAGLGHDEHERSTAASAAGPSSSGLSHVPAGGSVAQAGVAQDAANEAAKHGLGKDGSGVEGTTKVAPGVVQATPTSSSVAGVSDTSRYLSAAKSADIDFNVARPHSARHFDSCATPCIDWRCSFGTGIRPSRRGQGALHRPRRSRRCSSSRRDRHGSPGTGGRFSR